MSVKIYTVMSEQLSPRIPGDGFCVDIVRFADYEALEKERDTLKAKLAMINSLTEAAEQVNKLAKESIAEIIKERDALAAQVTAATGIWPRFQDKDLNALIRFNETCEDGEGYDIGQPAMNRLCELGLCRKLSHGIRCITSFGRWVVDAHSGEYDLEPLKTEDDQITEAALKMAQLREAKA